MATSITSYSVGLTLDARDYIQQSSLSRGETSKLVSQINAARTPADNYARSIALADKALKEGAISAATHAKLTKASGDAMNKAASSAKSWGSSLAKVAASYIGIRAVKSVISDSISLAAEAEQSSVAFRVLLKDAEKAKDMLAALKGFAASTPFQFPEIRDSGQMLLAFGFSASEVIGSLEMLGNIAAGTNQPIKELAELMGKARVQNTIYSEDLNQLTGRGINVLDGLAARFGITTDQVKKFASEGKIHFSDLQAVMQELSETDFAGLMTEQSKTLTGQWSTLKDELSAIKTELGEALLPLMKELVAVGLPSARSFKGGMQSIGSFKDDGVWFTEQGSFLTKQQADFLAARDDQNKSDLDFMKDQVAKRRADANYGVISATEIADIQAKAAAAKQAAEENSAEAQKRRAELAAEEVKKQKEADAQAKQDAKDKLAADKAAADAAKAAATEAHNNAVAALNAAREHFKEERQRQMQRQKDIVSGMSGAGAEVGSGDDVKFLAQQRNAMLAAASAPKMKEPTQEQLLVEARKQAIEIAKQTAQNTRQEELLKKILTSTETNGTRVIR